MRGMHPIKMDIRTITFTNTRRKMSSLRILAWFRFLLWWGVEMARQVFVYKKPREQIVRVTKSDRCFPVASWTFIGDETYCLVMSDKHRGVEIFSVSQMNQN